MPASESLDRQVFNLVPCGAILGMLRHPPPAPYDEAGWRELIKLLSTKDKRRLLRERFSYAPRNNEPQQAAPAETLSRQSSPGVERA